MTDHPVELAQLGDTLHLMIAPDLKPGRMGSVFAVVSAVVSGIVVCSAAETMRAKPAAL
jgi:hypothetical protein